MHHKLADDQSETFTAALLSILKANHEQWVSNRLSKIESKADPKQQDASGHQKYLFRLNTGKDILAVIGGAYAFSSSTDDPKDDEEMHLLGGFLQEVQDYGELYSDLESGSRVEAAYNVSNLLKELESAGFWVFGLRENRKMKFEAGKTSVWPTAIIQILRSSDPTIIKVDLDELSKANRPVDEQ